MQSHTETSFHRKHTLRNKWTYFANFQTQKPGLPPSCSSWYEDCKTARQRSKSPLKHAINLQQSLSQFCFKCSVIYCNINITYTEQTLNRGTAVRKCWKLMVGNGGGGVEFKMRTEGKFIITLWEINSHLPLFSQVSRERLWRGCCLGVCACGAAGVVSAIIQNAYNLKTIQTRTAQAFAVFRLRLFWVTKQVTLTTKTVLLP